MARVKVFQGKVNRWYVWASDRFAGSVDWDLCLAQSLAETMWVLTDGPVGTVEAREVSVNDWNSLKKKKTTVVVGEDAEFLGGNGKLYEVRFFLNSDYTETEIKRPGWTAITYDEDEEDQDNGRVVAYVVDAPQVFFPKGKDPGEASEGVSWWKVGVFGAVVAVGAGIYYRLKGKKNGSKE